MYGSFESSSRVTLSIFAILWFTGKTASISSLFSGIVVSPSAASGFTKPKSTLPSLIHPLIFVYSPCFSSKLTDGYISLNSFISPGSQLHDMLASVPIRITPLPSPFISFLFSINSLWELYTFLIYGKNSFPSGESSMPFLERCISTVSSSSSSVFIIWLTADCVYPILSAAFVKLPVSVILTNASYCITVFTISLENLILLLYLFVLLMSIAVIYF